MQSNDVFTVNKEKMKDLQSVRPVIGGKTSLKQQVFKSPRSQMTRPLVTAKSVLSDVSCVEGPVCTGEA